MATKFRTQYNRVQICHHSGARLKPTYKISYTETGSQDLVECGVVDVYEEIQSYKDSCDLKTIIERFMAGDVNALNRSQTFFADVVGMPNSLAGFLNMRSEADRYFMSLPPEVRAQFGNDSNQFFAQIGSDRFNTIMSKFVPAEDVPSPTPEKGEEVVNEQKSE